MKRIFLGAALALALTAPTNAQTATRTDAPVSEQALREHIAILASDAYQGRAPGTDGERKTITYMAQHWANAGLKGGMPDGGWYQPVTLVDSKTATYKMTLTSKGKKLDLSNDAVLLRSRDAAVSLTKLPMLFTGPGLDADGKVIGDVKGKLVLVTLTMGSQFPDVRKQRAALAEAGAAAVIAIAPPDYAWAQAKRAFSGRTMLASAAPSAAVEGLLRSPSAEALFAANGHNYAALLQAASAPGFKPVAFKSRANLDVATEIKRTTSYNVVGKIPGTQGADKGVVLFLGHWDHLGVCRPEGATDRICNGATDNASGLAVLIETAKRLGRSLPDRDIYFLATTAEEKGLLGAYAFAENPVVPLDKITAAFNIDTIAITPRGSKVAIIGRGTTPLDSAVDAVATRLGRTPETSTASNVMIQRQDGWALKSKGVPVVMVSGSFADMKVLESFLGGVYHKPEDELTDTMPLGGAAEDADLHIALGRYFANLVTWAG